MTEEKKFRIAEIFGPTIQGEGELIGTPCIFIRFGGCDFRCPPCDSPHAVLPHLVAQLPRLSTEQIIREVYDLDPECKWVVFSGGNPGLFDLDDLVAGLIFGGTRVMIETQGSVWMPWIARCHSVCVSPKGPGMASRLPQQFPGRFVSEYKRALRWDSRLYFKVVCFDELDFKYARELHQTIPDVPLFLSVGNHSPGPSVGNGGRGEAVQTSADIAGLLDRLQWLSERVTEDPEMRDVRVLPQMHVLTWGNERGR